MVMPVTPDLLTAIAGVSLHAGHPQTTTDIPVPSAPSRDVHGLDRSSAPLFLRFAGECTVSPESLLERIAKELRRSGHAGDQQFAKVALALSNLMPGPKSESIGKLNVILNACSDADVNLYYVSVPGISNEFSFEMPPFSFGQLRTERLKFQCERAESDYFELWGHTLRGRWAMERAPKRVRIFDVPRIRERLFAGMSFGDPLRPSWEWAAWSSLVTSYFSLQNACQFEQLWAELSLVQAPYVAIGAPYVDPRGLEHVLESTRIAVFLKMGARSEGFVAPAGVGFLMVDLANAHKRIPNAIAELQQRYEFDGFDGSPLHSTIQLFTNFIGRARRHESAGRIDEAVLHHIIALELVFGDRHGIYKSVSERVALLTYRQAGKSFEKQRAWLASVYDLRSKYVHEGRSSADETILEALNKLSEVLFRCLLELQHSNGTNRDETVLTKWLALLDYYSKGAIAGIEPSESDLRKVHAAAANT